MSRSNSAAAVGISEVFVAMNFVIADARARPVTGRVTVLKPYHHSGLYYPLPGHRTVVPDLAPPHLETLGGGPYLS